MTANLIDLIHREAQRLEEPTKCGMCSRLAERGHAADLGWTCVACCEMRPEYAVATLAAAGVTTAWIGVHRLGTIPAATDEAVRGLLDGLAS